MSTGLDVRAYIDRLRSESALPGDVRESLGQVEELHSKKLWHQLTESVFKLIKHESLQNKGLVEFYHNFIVDFENKINPLTFVEIVLIVVQQITEPADAVVFLEGIQEKVKNHLEAKVLCIVAIGGLKLKLSSLQEVKVLLEEAGTLLDSVTGITRVHARYYDLCSNFHKIRADHASYYHDALHYLGCIDIADLTREEQSDRAFSLGLAALLGKDVYNFGELLSHPVIHSLQGTDKEWLIKVMYEFNAGNLEGFDTLRPFWEQQPDLYTNQDHLLNKIRLLALMELVFRRHAHNRSIKFSDVCEAAKVSDNEVEMLVMKALSLGLVKGQIDEVRKEITMTWVQPRVLDLHQVENMQLRMSVWCDHIKATINFVKDEVPDAVVTH